MQNLTADEILAMIGQDNKQANSMNHAEVYYNYNSSSCSGSYSSSDSTLQQSTGPTDPTNESVVAPTAPVSSSGASHPGLKESPKKSVSPRKNVPRKVSTNDYYDQINMSVNEIRVTKRSKRMTAYLSLKDENDKKFSIYLRCQLTSSLDETLRSIKKASNTILEDQFYLLTEQLQPGGKLLMGRLRYNPRRFKIEDEHKTALKSALLAVYDYGSHMEALLYLLGEHYAIMLTDDITEKQKGIFDYTGAYKRDIEEEE